MLKSIKLDNLEKSKCRTIPAFRYRDRISDPQASLKVRPYFIFYLLKRSLLVRY